jgi:hypothetical protein
MLAALNPNIPLTETFLILHLSVLRRDQLRDLANSNGLTLVTGGLLAHVDHLPAHLKLTEG